MIAITPDPIDIAALEAAVGDPAHGGIAVFLGTTRAESDVREVVAITYEVYEELALDELRTIATECRERFAATVAVVHRVGRVSVGEASVGCAASARHRAAAFDACRYLIDELKVRVPIWKQFSYISGPTEWLDGRSRPADPPKPFGSTVND
jgi:molybdopterin synthase catalytic subunit